MASSDVSSVTKYFSTAAEGFNTTTSGTISAGASSVGLNNTTGLTNGAVFVGIIEPGQTGQQTFTGTVDISGSQITNVVWVRGTNVGHAGGVTVVDYVSGAAHNMTTAGILKQHTQAGAHTGIVTDTITATGVATLSGGTSLPAGDIGTADLADSAVSTAKIADSAVTPQKMLGIDMFAVDSTADGATPPAAGTGQFYIQSGTSVKTTNGAGGLSVTFPTAFPNGVLNVVVCDGDGNPTRVVSLIGSQVSKTGFGAVYDSLPSTPVRISYIAIGW